MRVLLLVPGVVLVLAGIALSAQFTLSGPEIPTDPLGWVGWTLILVGLAEMKVVDALTE